MRLEVSYRIVASGNHGQRRRLYAPHGNQFAFAELRLVKKRVGARQIHPEKPVRAGAAARSVAHPGVVGVLFEGFEAFADGSGVDRRHPEAFDGLSGVEVFDDFVHQKLPFAIRVTGVDEGVGPLDKGADGI